jgi:arsenite methyltransferase
VPRGRPTVGETDTVKKPVVPVGDYGLDAPGIVTTLGKIAAGFLGLTVIAGIVNVVWLMAIAFGSSMVFAVTALVMVRSSRVGKLRERVRMFDALGLEGNERVLDAGCGRGLLLVEAARRVPAGMAVGVDMWHDVDQSDDEPDVPLANAEIEGVLDQVEVHTADLRDLPFEDASFDVVVSSMTLHNLHDDDGRVAAIREIDRVLKPDGKLSIIDFPRTKVYVHALRACNWTDVKRSHHIWRMFPPVRYVRGSKPSSQPGNSTSEDSTTSAPASESSDAECGPEETPIDTAPAETAPATSEGVSPT